MKGSGRRNDRAMSRKDVPPHNRMDKMRVELTENVWMKRRNEGERLV